MKLLKRAWAWLDDRIGWSSAIWPIVVHPVPKVNWWYVLGSATLIAFIVQVVTGVALAFTYVPAPNAAYESLDFITNRAVFGNVVRGLHYWGSSAMVVLAFAHLAHVFLIGAFKFPREVNWLTGVVLLGMTLAMAFTGQLLRWNQDAYWAVSLMASMASRVPLVGDLLVDIIIAGQTVGGATLTRFYATHVFLIPAAMFVLVGLHLYLVIRHGVSEMPRPGRPVNPKTYRQEYDELLHRDGIPFWPDFAWKDVVFALVTGSLVLLLAVVLGAPELGPQANPTNLEAHPKPDWYFLWLFALLSYAPPALESLVIVGLPLLLGILLVIVPFTAPAGERSWKRRPWAVATVVFFGLSAGALMWQGHRSPWAPVLHAEVPASVSGDLRGDAARGSALFASEACLACHLVGGAGGQRGPDLTFVGDRLTREQLIWRILYGGNNMPAYGQMLSPDDLDALVAFLSERRSR
ncbi:MAG: cytochrome b N-terminal domain-containing protein [Chloroflexi bacterium]|nr:cytochrome b N-terminal domain-containing protein [Chloroflexota bacterium]